MKKTWYLVIKQPEQQTQAAYFETAEDAWAFANNFLGTTGLAGSFLTHPEEWNDYEYDYGAGLTARTGGAIVQVRHLRPGDTCDLCGHELRPL